MIHAVKIAYIDFGECDGYSLSGCRANVSGITVGYDRQWNQPIVNVTSPAWKEFVLYEVNRYLEMGFSGIMFDDLDVAG